MIEAIWAWAAHGDLLNQHFARGDGSTIPVALQDRSKTPGCGCRRTGLAIGVWFDVPVTADAA